MENTALTPFREPDHPISRYFFEETIFIDLERIVEMWLCQDKTWVCRLDTSEPVLSYFGGPTGERLFHALRRYRGVL